MRTAFVFTGGASLGAVHVGMLKALRAEGVHADLVVGASAGSVNAVGYAAGPDRDAAVDFLERVWCDIERKELVQWDPGQVLELLSGSRNHVFEVDRLRALMVRHAPVERLEQTAIPCHLVATDVRSGQEIILRRGPALDAVMASAAIPAIWPPVPWGDRLLMDGGIGSHAPVSEAIAGGAERILVLPSGYSCRLGTLPQTPLEMLVHALIISQVRQLITELDTYDGQVPIHVVPPPCPIDVKAYDFSQAPRLIAAAERGARGWLSSGGLESTALPSLSARSTGSPGTRPGRPSPPR